MLGALIYPKGTPEKPIKFESLFIPYIYKEIYFDGIYNDIFQDKKDMVVLDIGANIGVVTAYMQPFCKKLYAIEPSPEHYEALAENKRFNGWDNVETFNLAVADTNGEMDFGQNEFNRTMNSLMVEGLNNQHGIRPDGYTQTVKVKTTDLDSFLVDQKIKSVDFIKVDTEGAEEIILRSPGFIKAAPKIKSLMVAFHFPQWQQLVSHMIGLGYQARRYDCAEIVVLFTR